MCNLQFWSLYALSNTFRNTRAQLTEVCATLFTGGRNLESLDPATVVRAMDVLNANHRRKHSEASR